MTCARTPSPPPRARPDEPEGTHTHGIMGPEFETTAVARTPLGRVGQPGGVADVAMFLASNDSR